MRFKPGVRLEGAQPAIILAAVVVNDLFKEKGLELVITSVTDGTHGPNSLHYSGNAIDVRSWELKDVEGFAKEIRSRLTGEFDVVVEATHIHIEFDIKNNGKTKI